MWAKVKICSLFLFNPPPVYIVKTVDWFHHSGSSFTPIPKILSSLVEIE